MGNLHLCLYISNPVNYSKNAKNIVRLISYVFLFHLKVFFSFDFYLVPERLYYQQFANAFGIL